MPRLALRPLVLIAVLALMAVIVGAQAPAPQPEDQETAKIVVDLLERGHMARPVIDDDISVKWCDNFLKRLDPGKYYFLKADIDEFKKENRDLDDQIRNGDLEFARKVFERFLKRADERFKVQLNLLEQQHDFTVDEYLPDDADKLDPPSTVAEANERLRKKVKLDLLVAKVVEELDQAEAVRKLRIRYKDRNRQVHQVDNSELLQIYLTSLTETFDPHTAYLPPKELEDMLNQQLHLSLEGIGASLRSEDGYAIVSEIVPGMAADKDDRLRPEDKIIGIQKEDGTEIDLIEKKLNDVVRYIRGPRGTKVRLIVQPDGTKEKRIYELTRQKIELKEQHAKSKIIESKGPDGKPLKIGIISLPAFYGDTVAILRGDPNAVSATIDCRRILTDFKARGIDGVVVDLRQNGGGLLEEAKTLSGLFIDTGPVVQVKEAQGVKHLDDEDQGTAWEGPLVVLIDKASASASEIFAGVIKDYGRGLIVGDASTFGKGTVQSIVMISDHARHGRRFPQLNRGALKLTIQQFYRANGESTQINGVSPHIHIASMNDYRDLFDEAKLANAVKFDKVDGLAHDNYNRVPDDLVSRLEERSAERRKSEPKFQKLNQEIKKYIDRKARHTISLNEAKFRAEFVSEDPEDKLAEEKAKKDRKKKKYSEREVWAADFYNDEMIRIVTDYLTLGSKVLAAAPQRVNAPAQ
ncbi:MAG: carboxy terminal-processing peptidase [Isosphaeraceae bacterium]